MVKPKEKDNFIIRIDGNDISIQFLDGDVVDGTSVNVGLYIAEQNNIFISTKPTDNYIARTLFHELGHAFHDIAMDSRNEEAFCERFASFTLDLFRSDELRKIMKRLI